MRSVPNVFYAWDSARYTEEDGRFVDFLVDKGAGVKVGLTAANTFDQAGRTIAKSIHHRVGGKNEDEEGKEMRSVPRRRPGKLVWDCKFGDLRDQVAGAVSGIVRLGVLGLTVKALDDEVMLRAAVKARDDAYAQICSGFESKKGPDEKKPPPRPILFGVTDLSSSQKPDFEAQVMERAERIALTGLDGIVAPGRLLRRIRDRFPHLITLVVGVRLPWGEEIPNDDQRWTISHTEAAELGAHHLVIGRPIRYATDPRKTVSKIQYELNPA